MFLAVQIVFWLCILGLGHTYVLYPVVMKWLARGMKPGWPVYERGEESELPRVSVLMSLYNEEQVISEKMASLATLRYPEGKLAVYVGSDGSADGTNALVSGFGDLMPHLRFFPFSERRGKPPVINDLARAAIGEYGRSPDHVLVLTDANVILEPDTLFLLVRHFRESRMGAVDAHMRHSGLRREGISRSEHRYLSGEVRLKYAEGVLWGKMIGPFGGCYALRSDLFEPVPPNSLVDDFYLVFRVLEKGYMAVNDLEAVCHEGATHGVGDEFRRKKRIAAGSFQNLARFWRWVVPPRSTLGFAFFSHKVLRWTGGFLLAGSWLACGVAATYNQTYLYLFLAYTAGLAGFPLGQLLLQRLGVQSTPVKNIAYFLYMNVALIAGFFKWARGIRTNTWQRTRRYVD